MCDNYIFYTISYYGGTSNLNLHKILIFQKRAIKNTLKLKKTESFKKSFIRLGILTVYSLYNLRPVHLEPRKLRSRQLAQ